jgi:hypothetical protein
MDDNDDHVSTLYVLYCFILMWMNDNDNEKWNIQHRQTIIEGEAVTVDKNEWKFISSMSCVYVCP